ncbi:MAG: DUF6382 domain-containing protein [Oscillospiraceae bacterium]
MGKIIFENQDFSSFLVYQLEPPEQLDGIALEMLSNNKLEGVIAPVFVQKENTVFLRYNITSKVTLESYYAGSIGKKRFLTSMSSIAAALQSAEEYMLRLDDFALQKDLIFVEIGTGKAEMLYFPLETPGHINPKLSDFVKQILMGAVFDQNEDTAYVSRILNLCNESSFSLAAFHTLLQQLRQAEAPKAPVAAAPPVAPAAPAPQPAAAAPVAPAVPAAPPPAAAPSPPPKKGLFSSLFGGKKAAKPKAPPAAPPVNFAIPNQAPPSVSAPPAAPPQGGPALVVQAPVPQAPPAQPAPAPAVVPPTRSAPASSQGGAFGNTMVLDQSADATTVLSDSAAAPAAQPRFVLTREKTGEKIEINKSPFRLGKDASYVDYCITNNATVSRGHADLLVENGTCYVVDNNSTNHTYMGGQMLTNNTRVPLQNGAELMLSNERFTFQVV